MNGPAGPLTLQIRPTRRGDCESVIIGSQFPSIDHALTRARFERAAWCVVTDHDGVVVYEGDPQLIPVGELPHAEAPRTLVCIRPPRPFERRGRWDVIQCAASDGRYIDYVLPDEAPTERLASEFALRLVRGRG